VLETGTALTKTPIRGKERRINLQCILFGSLEIGLDFELIENVRKECLERFEKSSN